MCCFALGRGGPIIPGEADTSAEGQLQLPSLEGGKRASEVIGIYMKAALGRAAKLGDTLTKMYAVPQAERTEACKKTLVCKTIVAFGKF